MKNGKSLFVAVVILISSTVSGWAGTPQDPIDPGTPTDPACRVVNVTVVGGSNYKCYCKDGSNCTPPSGMSECSSTICSVSLPPPSPGSPGN
jgi:hypothetical protein